jgi:hypothetical protein
MSMLWCHALSLIKIILDLNHYIATYLQHSTVANQTSRLSTFGLISSMPTPDFSCMRSAALRAQFD